MKINFVLFERTFKVINEDPVQLFRALFGFRNILTKNSAQSGILVTIIIELINWVFDDVHKHGKLAKTSPCGTKFLRKFS